MPAVTATNVNAETGAFTPTTVTLDGSTDTLTYDATKNQILFLLNTTGTPVTNVTITSAGASNSVNIPGTGATFDASAPYTLSASIADNGSVVTRLKSIERRISPGEITISGGNGLTAYLLEV